MEVTINNDIFFNVQPEHFSTGDSYIATIQKKSIVEGLNLQVLGTSLNQLRYVELNILLI